MIRIENLSFSYKSKKKTVQVLNNLCLQIPIGKTLGLVGASGSGKTTLCFLLLNLLKATQGTITYPKNLRIAEEKGKIQMVFQDPTSSLNPRMNIEEIIQEPLKIYNMGNSTSRSAKVKESMELVGLDESLLKRYPHELSGGQKQRVSIARALTPNPSFLILDEPTASLDVSSQAQIINLLTSLQEKLKLTYLFISHDLALVRYVSDYIAVLYEGRIIELSNASEVFENPKTPYLKNLITSISDQSLGLQIHTRQFTEESIFSVIGPSD
jgi:ABC-type dipeptide/oligopeptide/nickel transport system ATPase subunit